MLLLWLKQTLFNQLYPCVDAYGSVAVAYGHHMQCITSRSIRMAALCARGAILDLPCRFHGSCVRVTTTWWGAYKKDSCCFSLYRQARLLRKHRLSSPVTCSLFIFRMTNFFLSSLSCWTGRLIEFLFSPSDSFCGLYILRWQFSWIRYILSRLHFVGSKC